MQHQQPCSNTTAEFEYDVQLAEATFRNSQIDRLALDEAALYHDEPAFIDALDDAAAGGEFYDALHRLYREIIETKDGEAVAVSGELREQVKRVAIGHFRDWAERIF